MAKPPTARGLALWQALDRPKPPQSITQEAYESDDRHLRHLVRLKPGEKADASDLWNYTQDLLYTKIQTPLFVYCLPFCLEAWRANLLGSSTEYGGFVEHFNPVLAGRRIFEEQLTPTQTQAVSEFMRQTILEEMSNQSGLTYQGALARPYRWTRAFTTFGVLLPDMEALWREWWLVKGTGHAVAALQYISCLMYAENENPVFAPWTRENGGGPPCLWEFDGHLYSHRWLAANVDFARSVLKTPIIHQVLQQAVTCLQGQQEHGVAAEILADFPLCVQTLESRCEELPHLLERIQGGTHHSWAI